MSNSNICPKCGISENIVQEKNAFEQENIKLKKKIEELQTNMSKTMHKNTILADKEKNIKFLLEKETRKLTEINKLNQAYLSHKIGQEKRMFQLTNELNDYKKKNEQLKKENEDLKEQMNNVVALEAYTRVINKNNKLCEQNKKLVNMNKILENEAKSLKEGNMNNYIIPKDIQKINQRVEGIRNRFVDTYGSRIINGNIHQDLHDKQPATNQLTLSRYNTI